MVFDPDYRGTQGIATSLHRVDYSPYEGLRQEGRADKVFLRGELVAAGGSYVGKAGSGEFVPGKPYGLCYEGR